jgi:poly(3-hydroxyalkanoate) synthetase
MSPPSLIDLASRRYAAMMDHLVPAPPPPPRWSLPHEAEAVREGVVLRRFGERGAERPVLVVTPQVNHSVIADYAPDQSLVRTLLAAGVGEVAVTDWLPPPERPYGIADSLDDLRACLDRLGGAAHLVGLCQGGWQVAMLAALDPERALSLSVAAAPIDAHAGATMLHAFTLGLPFAFFEGLVTSGGGRMPGSFLSAGFNALKPYERYVYNPGMAWFCGDDEVFTERASALRDWYRRDKDVAGQLYLETVRGLFMENRLVKGSFEVGGRRVDLGRIEGDVYLVAGARDHITPREQVFALARHAPRARCRAYVVDAGHIGVFMGRKALSSVWPEIGRALAGNTRAPDQAPLQSTTFTS